jgi:hypothetical protein
VFWLIAREIPGANIIGELVPRVVDKWTAVDSGPWAAGSVGSGASHAGGYP